MKGVVIAGTGSGVGKTSITLGIMSKLSRTMKVQGFKIGPDFIDPMYHSAVTGRGSRNLDSFMMSKDVVGNLARFGSVGSDVSIVEGVRGLFEGSSGLDDTGSTAEMAKILGLPVILIVNARSLTRSAAAIINGFKEFDKEVNIAGVILNNVSGIQHETKLRDAIEQRTNTRILGIVKRDPELAISERHLGLDTNVADTDVVDKISRMVDRVDIDAIMDICESSVELEYEFPYVRRDTGLTVAIPKDDAFCFYYKENIECMEASGMNIRYFSPLRGDRLPDADIYYLGGGYPEMHVTRLSENKDFLQGLKNAQSEGKVILGECGGMLTMCSEMNVDGKRFDMAGILDAKADMVRKRHGPSYVIARPNSNCGMFDQTVKGHTFHYSSVTPDAGSKFGLDVIRGQGLEGMKDGLVKDNAMGSYMHQHALSVTDWMGRISEICE